jgi:hypothetical protein
MFRCVAVGRYFPGIRRRTRSINLSREEQYQHYVRENKPRQVEYSKQTKCYVSYMNCVEIRSWLRNGIIAFDIEQDILGGNQDV